MAPGSAAVPAAGGRDARAPRWCNRFTDAPWWNLSGNLLLTVPPTSSNVTACWFGHILVLFTTRQFFTSLSFVGVAQPALKWARAQIGFSSGGVWHLGGVGAPRGSWASRAGLEALGRGMVKESQRSRLQVRLESGCSAVDGGLSFAP